MILVLEAILVPPLENSTRVDFLMTYTFTLYYQLYSLPFLAI